MRKISEMAEMSNKLKSKSKSVIKIDLEIEVLEKPEE